MAVGHGVRVGTAIGVGRLRTGSGSVSVERQDLQSSTANTSTTIAVTKFTTESFIWSPAGRQTTRVHGLPVVRHKSSGISPLSLLHRQQKHMRIGVLGLRRFPECGAHCPGTLIAHSPPPVVAYPGSVYSGEKPQPPWQRALEQPPGPDRHVERCASAGHPC